MIKKLTIAALLLSLTSVIGCGPSDPHEKVIVEIVSCMEDMGGIIEGVTDEASAKAAKPEIEKIGVRVSNMQKKMKELGEPDKEKNTSLEKKYKDQMDAAQKKINEQMKRLASKPACAAIIGEAMSKAIH